MTDVAQRNVVALSVVHSNEPKVHSCNGPKSDNHSSWRALLAVAYRDENGFATLQSLLPTGMRSWDLENRAPEPRLRLHIRIRGINSAFVRQRTQDTSRLGERKYTTSNP